MSLTPSLDGVVSISDPTIADALAVLATKFSNENSSTFEALEGTLTYQDDDMVLAVHALEMPTHGLKWLAITVLPSSVYAPPFAAKIVATALVIFVVSVVATIGVTVVHRRYRAVRIRAVASMVADGVTKASALQFKGADKEEHRAVAVAFFFAGVGLTVVSLGIWVVGLQGLVQQGVDGITTSVSSRVAQYALHVASVPTLLNSQSAAFAGTAALPLPGLGYGQGNATRDVVRRYLWAQSSAAALSLLPDREVEATVATGDGMLMSVYSVAGEGGEVQAEVAWSDASTTGDVWHYRLLDNGEVDYSSRRVTTDYGVQNETWYSQVGGA